MIKKIGISTAGNVQTLEGLSTDTKPIDVGNGSVFIEVNTGNIFIFSNNINPATTTGWWLL